MFTDGGATAVGSFSAAVAGRARVMAKARLDNTSGKWNLRRMFMFNP
jgi:hypothetical protein